MVNTTLITLFFSFGAGMALRRVAPKYVELCARTLTFVLIYIALPAVILQSLPDLPLSVSADVILPVVIAWLAVALGAGLVLLLGRWLKLTRPVTGCLLLLVGLGNTSFFGFPMVEGLLGAEFLPEAIIYDQFGSFLALAIYGSSIVALYGEGQGPLQLWAIGRRILLFPPFIASVAALLLPRGSISPLDVPLALLSRLLLPVALVIIALRFRGDLSHHLRQPLLYGLILKLMVVPVILALLCIGLGIRGKGITVSLFESAMPPMVTAGIFAMNANLEKELASALVGYGIFAAFLTLPCILLLLQVLHLAQG